MPTLTARIIRSSDPRAKPCKHAIPIEIEGSLHWGYKIYSTIELEELVYEVGEISLRTDHDYKGGILITVLDDVVFKRVNAGSVTVDG